jgi:hypothetical protein
MPRTLIPTRPAHVSLRVKTLILTLGLLGGNLSSLHRRSAN